MSKGLSYVYCGNVHNIESDSTWCSNCGHLLIQRDWYQLGEMGIDKNATCNHCGQICDGIY